MHDGREDEPQEGQAVSRADANLGRVERVHYIAPGADHVAPFIFASDGAGDAMFVVW